MITSGSLAPIKMSPRGNSSQGFYNYSLDGSIANRKIEHKEAQAESSDLSDTILRVRLLELTTETNENVKKTLDQVSLLNAILAKFMCEIKASQKNLGGDFT
jgi:hypothetical protein